VPRKKRKKSSLPTRVYKYALLPPLAHPDADAVCKAFELAGPDLVDESFEAARDHYNDLVEVERRRRHEFRDARATLFPGLAKLEEDQRELNKKLELALAAVKASKAEAKSRKVDPEAKACVKRLRDELRALRIKLKVARAEANESPLLKGASDLVDEAAWAAVKALRKKTYWGTYLLVEEQAKQASGSRTDPEYDRTPPHLLSNRLGVHFLRGIEESDLSTNNLMRIDPLPTFKMRKKSGVLHAEGRAARTTLWFRVRSTAKRRPVFARFPMVMHRPLPEGCKIKDAYLTRRRGSARVPWLYGLCVVLESDRLERQIPCPEQEGTAAVNFGWRLVGGELRVALVNRGDLGIEEVRLPARFLSEHAKCRDLQEILDESFDAAKATLVKWIAGHPKTPEEFLLGLRDLAVIELDALVGRLAQYEKEDGEVAAASARVGTLTTCLRDEFEVARHLLTESIELAKADPASVEACEDTLEALFVSIEQAETGASKWHLVPEEWRDELQLVTDDAFENLIRHLREWASAHALLPPAFREAFANIGQWKSQHRLAELAWYWRDHRIEGDDAVFEVVTAWKDKYRHLDDWLVNMRRHLQDWRANYYRNWAKELATTSARLVVDTFKISQVARRERPEEEATGGQAARLNRVLASPSSLRTMILEAAAKYHCEVVAAETSHKTRRCNACGFVHPGAVVELDHACENPAGCGALWDQDVNNTDNLLDDHEGGEVVPLVRPAGEVDGEVVASARESFGAAREKIRGRRG
jgi:hypothetical protein